MGIPKAEHCNTELMLADIGTKLVTSKAVWERMIKNVCFVKSKVVPR